MKALQELVNSTYKYIGATPPNRSTHLLKDGVEKANRWLDEAHDQIKREEKK